MPQINYDVWLESYPAYTGLNTRTGTAAITDTDYDDFAPFSLAYYQAGANKYTLWNWLNGGELSLDDEIDKSMCYVGMYNDELPQLNIAAYAFDTYDTIDNPLYKTDNTQIQGYFCYDTWNFMFQQTQLPGYARTYADGRIYDKDFTYITNKLQIYKDGNVGTQPHVNPPLTINLHSWLNTYLSFGIKSLILEINVAYKTSDGTYYPNQARCTLAAYIANTTEWKQSHPILQAYCIPYIRGNTNGTYSNTGRAFETYNCTQTFSPAFTLPYLSQNSDYPDIITYTTTLADGQSTRNGYFPLYGAMVGELALSSSATAIQNMGVLVPLMGVNKGALGKRQSSGYMYYWLELDGSDDDNIEWLRRAAAAYGLFFCDSIGTLGNSGRDTDRWFDDNMMCGTIDDNGRTNGDYTRGVYNLLQRQNNWSDSTQSPYDPSITPTPTDNTQYSDTTDFRTLIGTATFNKQYAITDSTMLALSLALTESMSLIPPNVSAMEYSLSTFLTNNPLDCIISLRKYPVYSLVDSGTDIPIYFGAYVNANVKGIPCNTTIEHIVFTFKYSTKNSLYPHFGDFRDFEPYTRAELVIPFCGSIPLTCADFMGHDINVHMFIDYITGLATAYIAADNLVMSSVSGSIGIDIPLTGVQSATLQSQRVNAVMQRKNAELAMGSAVTGALTSSIGTLASISTGNVIGGVASGAGLVSSVSRIQQSENAYDKADYDLKHMQVPFKEVQAGSPLAADCMEYDCRLLIYRPVMADNYDPESYAKTVGFACLESGKVSGFTGLTVGNINTGGLSVTETEKRQIEKLFANGVIL